MHKETGDIDITESGLDRRKFIGGVAAALPAGMLLSGIGAPSAMARELASAASAGPLSKPLTIAFPQTGGTTLEFFTVVFNGARAAAKDLGVKLNITQTGTFDVNQQGKMVTAAIASKPDGIITGNWNASAMKAPITTAVKQGIPVVIYNSNDPAGPAVDGALTFVGQDDVVAGHQAGAQFKAAGVKKALIANSDPSASNLRTRIKAFKEGFGGPTVLVNAGISNQTASEAAIKAAIQANPGCNGVFATGGPAGEPAIAAVTALNKLGKLKMATYDITPKILSTINAGHMLFAIDQQPFIQGYYPVVILALYKRLGITPVAGESLLTGPAFVTKQNAAKVIKLSAQGLR